MLHKLSPFSLLSASVACCLLTFPHISTIVSVLFAFADGEDDVRSRHSQKWRLQSVSIVCPGVWTTGTERLSHTDMECYTAGGMKIQVKSNLVCFLQSIFFFFSSFLSVSDWGRLVIFHDSGSMTLKVITGLMAYQQTSVRACQLSCKRCWEKLLQYYRC